jgi:hypothetical protein
MVSSSVTVLNLRNIGVDTVGTTTSFGRHESLDAKGQGRFLVIRADVYYPVVSEGERFSE